MPFRRSRPYRSVLGCLIVNAAAAAVCFVAQVVFDAADLAGLWVLWILAGALVGSPLVVLATERHKAVPHETEAVCGAYSAAAAFFVALYGSIGWPGLWLVPPVLLSVFLIGAPALRLRVHARESDEREIARLREALSRVEHELSILRRPWWQRLMGGGRDARG